jgi:YhcH/YjgK/YiaL family protein
MIIDQLENAALYYGLGERMATALRYLQQADPATLQPGRYEVDGTNVHAMVQHYDTKPREKGRWEAHRRYFDIQFLAEGTELMGFANIRQVTLGDYDEVKDFQALQADGEFVLMRPGTFVILAPHDAHMPGLAVAEPRPARKIVMKVRV